MRAGPLRHRLTIQQPASGALNAYGEGPSGFTTFATVWGRIEPASGRDQEYARGTSQIISHKITIRYLAGLVSNMIISYSGRTFAINAVLDFEERRRWLTIFCTEKA